MQITYDPAKDARNVEERGLPFALVRDFEWSTALILEDDRFDYGECRYRAMGYIGDRLHVVVFTHGVTQSTSSAFVKPTNGGQKL
ncbi:BrnT family toxin [Pseudomonas sp. Z4-20]|uniref:BrnT family toxin n=1 Tax=Pseudomonas sp. Z4-20 TaxID=2817414 RepID=UPI003DA90F52